MAVNYATTRTPDITVGPLTLVLDTNAYAQNDVLAVAVEVADVLRAVGEVAMLSAVRLYDKSGQDLALTLFFFDQATAMGALNAAEAIADVDASEIKALVTFASGDYVDLANFSVAQKQLGDVGLGNMLSAAAGTSVYLGAKLTDAAGGTYAAGDLVVEFDVLRT